MESKAALANLKSSNSKRGEWKDQEIRHPDYDRFGFIDYAAVLCNSILNADTPLTLGVFGSWGSGKSSLMKLIKYNIERTKHNRVVETAEIDVWQLATQEEVWNAFLQAVFSQIHAKISLWQRLDKEKFFIELIKNIVRIIVVSTPLVIAVILGEPEAGIEDLLPYIAHRGGIFSSVALYLWVLTRFGPIVSAAKETVSFDVKNYLKHPNFEKQITALSELEGKFNKYVDALVGEKGLMVIFVDDLDRCAPDVIPKVLEAIKLFTTSPRCVYVLGLDYEIVREGIKTRFKFNEDQEAAEYLEKIVQIPFHLPPISENRIESFVKEHYPELREEVPTAPQVFAAGLEPNPRKIKRALNIFRTVLALADMRVKNWEMDIVEGELIAKMVAIQSRFRKLHEYLTENPEFLSKLEELAAIQDQADLTKQLEVTKETLLGGDWDSEPNRNLIKQTEYPALQRLLKCGEYRFRNDPDIISSYIFLVSATEGTGTELRPSKTQRDVFLSGNFSNIKTNIELLENRYKKSFDRVRKIYTTRLLDLATNEEKYSPEQIASVKQSISIFNEWDVNIRLLLNSVAPDIKAFIDEIHFLEDDIGKMQFLHDLLVKKLIEITREEISSFPSAWDTTLATVDQLMDWQIQDFEPSTVYIPAGEFKMGSDDDDPHAQENEKPQFILDTPAFRIGRYPVTVEQYRVFLADTKDSPPPDWEKYKKSLTRPVVNISWQNAAAYCQWLAKKTDRVYRLPWEYEWEKAARGTNGLIYPWGNGWTPKHVNSRNDNVSLMEQHPSPIGSYTPRGDSPFGVADMLGNVWEWCKNGFVRYPATIKVLESTSPSGNNFVLRGGAFNNTQAYLRCAARLRDKGNARFRNYGFRVAVSLVD